MVQANIEKIKGKAVSPFEIQETQMVSETARSFVKEWATFDRGNQQEYFDRLKIYGKENEQINPGQGTQRCNDVSVVETKSDKERYRVILICSLSRLMESSSGIVSVPEARIQARKETEKSLLYWKDFLQTVEVTLMIKDGKPSIIGWPVIVASPEIKQTDVLKHFDTEEPPDDFRIFAQQMLEMYYAGKDLKNYCVENTSIASPGSRTLKRVDIMGINKTDSGIQALIKTTCNTESLEGFEQLLVLNAAKKDNKWFLERIGSY